MDKRVDVSAEAGGRASTGGRNAPSAMVKAGGATVVGSLVMWLLVGCSGADQPAATLSPTQAPTTHVTWRSDSGGGVTDDWAATIAATAGGHYGGLKYKAAAIVATADDDGVITNEEAAAIVQFDHDQVGEILPVPHIYAIELRVAKGDCYSIGLGRTGEEFRQFEERYAAASDARAVAVYEALLAEIRAMETLRPCTDDDRTNVTHYRQRLQEDIDARRE